MNGKVLQVFRNIFYAYVGRAARSNEPVNGSMEKWATSNYLWARFSLHPREADQAKLDLL